MDVDRKFSEEKKGQIKDKERETTRKPKQKEGNKSNKKNEHFFFSAEPNFTQIKDSLKLKNPTNIKNGWYLKKFQLPS